MPLSRRVLFQRESPLAVCSDRLASVRDDDLGLPNAPLPFLTICPDSSQLDDNLSSQPADVPRPTPVSVTVGAFQLVESTAASRAL